MWPPKTKLIYDITGPLSSEIMRVCALHLPLLAVSASFSQALGKKINKIFVISRLESVLGGCWCHLVIFLF